MIDLIADRIAAMIVGVALGVIIAIGILVWTYSMDMWWILIGLPMVCGLASMLVGKRAVEVFKEIAKWTT
jgi:hypothetical protein